MTTAAGRRVSRVAIFAGAVFERVFRGPGGIDRWQRRAGGRRGRILEPDARPCAILGANADAFLGAPTAGILGAPFPGILSAPTAAILIHVVDILPRIQDGITLVFVGVGMWPCKGVAREGPPLRHRLLRVFDGKFPCKA
jgi:hypothetical protein